MIHCRLFRVEDTLLEITYTITPDDLWRYNKLVVDRVPAWRLQGLFRYAFVPVCVFVFYSVLNMTIELRLLATLVALIVWIPFCLWSAKRQNRLVINNRPGVIGLHTLSIKPEGIHQKTSLAEAMIQWSAICDIDQNKDVIGLFMDKRYALVVPKRTFATPAEAERFFATSHAYWRSAKDGTPLPELDNPAAAWPPAPRTL